MEGRGVCVCEEMLYSNFPHCLIQTLTIALMFTSTSVQQVSAINNHQYRTIENFFAFYLRNRLFNECADHDADHSFDADRAIQGQDQPQRDWPGGQ